jgi:hypothetical protein
MRRFSQTCWMNIFFCCCVFDGDGKSLMLQDVHRCEQQIYQKRKIHDHVLSQIEAPIPVTLPLVLRRPVSVPLSNPHAPSVSAPDCIPGPVISPNRTAALSPFHPINEHHSFCSVRDIGTISQLSLLSANPHCPFLELMQTCVRN